MEQAFTDESMGKENMPRFDSPVNITLTSHRNRKHDQDGVSVKAVIDGLVAQKILQDDSREEVKSITYKSVKCKISEEKTVIEVEKV